MHPRSGKSLVEMLVVMSLMAVILGAVATTLHVVMRSAGVGATSLALTANRTRLARQFRSDAHSAVGAKLIQSEDGTGDRLQLERPDATKVVYRYTAESIVREVLESDVVRGREYYAVAKGNTRFAADDQRVELTHTSIAGPSSFVAVRGPLPPVLHVEAMLGRDYRFLSEKPTAASPAL